MRPRRFGRRRDTLIIRGWKADDRVLLGVATEARPDEYCLSNAYAEVR